MTPSKLFKPDRRRRNLGDFLQAFLREKFLLLLVLVLAGILVGLGVATPYLSRTVMDVAIPRGDRSLVWLIAGTLGALSALRFATTLLRQNLLILLRARLDHELLGRFVARLVKLPYSFFQRRTLGDLIVRAQANSAVREAVSSVAIGAVVDGGLAILYLALLAHEGRPFAYLATLLAIGQIGIVVLARPRYQYHSSELLDAQAKASNALAETIAGIETLKLAGAEDRFAANWKTLYGRELHADLRRRRLSSIVESAVDVLRFALLLGVLLVGAVLALEQRASIGTLVAAVALVTAFNASVAGLTMTLLGLQMLRVYLERIEDALNREPEQMPQAFKTKDVLTSEDEFRGSVKLESVSFRYDRLDEDVLCDVSLNVPAGSTVAIVGGSGSGKSTLAALLIGLYKQDSGSILLDDREIHQWNIALLRARMGFVPQYPWFFNATIADNLLLGASRPPMELKWAAEMACVSADIELLPQGYGTVLNDRATSLSGGQRQRIAIARALLTRPRILILDEATSQIDMSTEQKILKNLKQVECTKIIVTHRLSAIDGTTKIFVMKAGRIVEAGTVRQLIRRDGEFVRLGGHTRGVDAKRKSTSPGAKAARR